LPRGASEVANLPRIDDAHDDAPLAKSRDQRPFIAAGCFDADVHGRQLGNRFKQLTAALGGARIAIDVLAAVDRHVPMSFGDVDPDPRSFFQAFHRLPFLADASLLSPGEQL
jgi:hypothetical protein